MDSLCEGLIICKLNSFLSLSDKIQLSKTNRFFMDIENKTKNYHIGTIIGENLGISMNTIDDDMVVLRENKLEFIKYISDFLDNPRQNVSQKKYSLYPLGRLIRALRFNRQECIEMLNNNNYLTLEKRRFSVYNNKFLKKNFINTYVLLLN